MVKQIKKQDGKKTCFIGTIIFFSCIIIGFELFYLFKLYSQEKLPKRKEKSLSINALNLVGWINGYEFSQNISHNNGVLTVNNTYGTLAKGNFFYVNRTEAIPIINNFIIELRFFKKKGTLVAIDLISENRSDDGNIYIGNEGLEISLSGDNEIHITSFNSEKKIREIYYIGKMPSTNFLRIEVVKNFISVKDRTGESIGTTFFTYNPFEEKEKMFVGLKVWPDSIMNISQFLIYTKEESP